MELKHKLSIHNRFDIEVINAKTGEIRQRAQAENIICNNLYTRLCNSNASSQYLYFYCIYWGSGTGTPAATDTNLFHQEGRISISNVGSATYSTDYVARVASCTRMIQLDEQTSVGVEISEVGIGCELSSGGLCTHAMLEDMNGNPITIEKTNVDIINIYATVYFHWSASSDGSMQWNSNAFRRWMFGIEKANFVAYVRPSKELYPFYHAGNFTNDYFRDKNDLKGLTFTGNAAEKKFELTCARYPVADMNIGGLGMFFFGYNDNMNFMLPVEDFYPGDDITNEAVGTGDGETTRFTLDFDFPENISVYVNGTKRTSGVSFRRICIPPTDDEYQAGGQPQLYIRRLRAGSTPSHKEMIMYQMPSHNCNEGSSTNRIHFFPIGAGWIIENTANIIGFASIKNDSTGKIYGSNDLTNWVLLADANAGTVELTGAEQTYRYYKNDGSAEARLYWNDMDDGAAIIFDTAPAVGDVITANYHTPYVAKDADHVFDLKVTFQFGEYTE